VPEFTGSWSARGVRRAATRANLPGWLFVVLVTALVEASIRLFDLHDSVATPSSTFRALAEGISSGTLSGEIGTTLESYAEGFALAIAGGVVLGVVIGSSRTLLDASSLVIEFLRPIPAVALIPLAILLFGLGTPMHRFVIAYAAVWPILINTLYGVRGTDRLLHDVARTSGVTRLGALLRVTLPSSLPSIATGIRVSASIALLVGVTAEFVTPGTGGIGAYMQRQQFAYQIPELYAAVVLVGALGYTINALLRVAERRIVFWVGEERVVR
jgi:NitT/TauT family transport system permease protein